jgi:hypothetical protein
MAEDSPVDDESSIQAPITLAHRLDIGRARSLAMSLLAELEYQTLNADHYESLKQLFISAPEGASAEPERLHKTTAAFDRAMSLSSRTKIMKNLAHALRILIDLERIAFDFGDSTDARTDNARNEITAFFAKLRTADAGRLQFVPQSSDRVVD